MSAALAFLSAISLAASAAGPFEGQWIDLTHPVDEKTIYWPEEKGFGGTHLSAPRHFYLGRRTVDGVPLEQLAGPAAVVDVSAPCAENRDYQVQVADFQRWEKRHGEIPAGSIVLIRTGFSRHWPERKRYLGTEETGAKAVSQLHFPGLHPSSARWLVARRRVKAVGIDSAGVDHGPSRRFESHVAFAQADVPVFENVAHLERLPPTGASVIALPLKLKSGNGAPLRIAAFFPK